MAVMRPPTAININTNAKRRIPRNHNGGCQNPLASFTKGADVCGFVIEHVTADTFRGLTRLNDWAKYGGRR
jgi:hypothetical protein